MLKAEDTVGDLGNEVCPRGGAGQLDHPVVDLNQHGRRNDEILVRAGKQLRAPPVIRVIAVEQGNNRARIEDEGHHPRKGRLAGMGGSLSRLSAMLCPPPRKKPARGRRPRRTSSAFSATASPSTLLRETPRRRASPASTARSSASAATVVRRFMHQMIHQM